MSATQPIKIAILAMGGEGGGVLADWIVDLGEHNGYLAQTTSVPGVAQRTGATIYYVELFPRAAAEADGARAGAGADADAGRRRRGARLRADGSRPRRAARPGHAGPHDADRVDAPRLFDRREDRDGRRPRRQRGAARRIAERAASASSRFDMARPPSESGSVISAVLFGALAGTGVLPFAAAASRRRSRAAASASREPEPSTPAFERAGATASRRAAASVRRLRAGAPSAATASPQPAPAPHAPRASRGARAGRARARRAFRPTRRRIARRRRAPADRLPGRRPTPRSTSTASTAVGRCAGARRRLLAETARHLALWMTYEDTIRVADLKTRATRFERVRGEVRRRATARCSRSTNSCIRACRRSARRCRPASAAG